MRVASAAVVGVAAMGTGTASPANASPDHRIGRGTIGAIYAGTGGLGGSVSYTGTGRLRRLGQGTWTLSWGDNCYIGDVPGECVSSTEFTFTSPAGSYSGTLDQSGSLGTVVTVTGSGAVAGFTGTVAVTLPPNVWGNVGDAVILLGDLNHPRHHGHQH